MREAFLVSVDAMQDNKNGGNKGVVCVREKEKSLLLCDELCVGAECNVRSLKRFGKSIGKELPANASKVSMFEKGTNNSRQLLFALLVEPKIQGLSIG